MYFLNTLGEDERRLNRARWEETLRAGGVLVSPFIHPEERAMMQRALEAGGRVIWIRPDGFPDRWKPSGRYFDYCAAGQLLLIGPLEYSTTRRALTRQCCESMNALARAVLMEPQVRLFRRR